ncbi:hypothetical protein KAU88_04210 [Candidatus Bathyarchaeota archaeon]|nr:hypothetical protein [Candidatus Bathyarchaeota archaeon]
MSEVIAFGQTLKPETMKEKGILKRPHKEVAFEVQERVIHKAAVHIALNRAGREIDPAKLPSASTRPEPKKALKELNDKIREPKVSPDIILDIIRKKTVKRPPDTGRIAKEVFEVTEHALVYTPIYEARCRRLKLGKSRSFQ